jgi:Citrate synthase, C-terminal domain
MTADDAGPAHRGGPLDDAPWPDKLMARVVTPGPRPAIHGYDVEADLAAHYSFAETVLLALTGELPSPERARAFEIALQFLAPSPVNEAPTHAAVVARMCNVMTSAVVGTAAIALAEQARAAVDAHASWIGRLDSSEPGALDAWAPSDDEERRSVRRLRQALDASGATVPRLECDIGRLAALIATLHFAGLKRADQLQAAFVLARLPSTLAEALATPAHSFRDYPVDLPPVRYVEP